MLAPRLLAKLVQLAEVEPGDNVLVVGGCCGYAAAILAQLAAHVVAVLPEKERADGGSGCPKERFGSATWQQRSEVLAAGWPPRAPYDVILVEGGVEASSRCAAGATR